MKKKLLIIIGVVIILFAGGYLYIRYGLLKTKDIKPDAAKSTSLLDLRPALIAKLKQIVKDGSNGLYN